MSRFLPLPFTRDDEWHWRWMHTVYGERLHRIMSGIGNEEGPIGVEHGEAVCGLTADLFLMPGVFSRMWMPRCKRCCAKLGIMDGDGAPYNSKTGEPTRLPWGAG